MSVPVAEDDVGLVKLFLEELIGCVVGCGCWEPGWDDDESVRAFAREGFAGWSPAPGPSPASVLEAFDRCFDAVDAGNLGRVSVQLELDFVDADDFRQFFGAARQALRDALSA